MFSGLVFALMKLKQKANEASLRFRTENWSHFWQNQKLFINYFL